MNSRKQLDAALADLGASSSLHGRHYWRSLEELSDRPEFQRLITQEFPEQADTWPDALSRRRFLTLMAASLALGGVGGCSVRPVPPAKIVPYVHPQEHLTPGRPLFFATTMTMGGDAVGLLAESHMGRPTKIEGNPDHPFSLGATSPYHQASVLTLYDPDRSQTVTFNGQIRAWHHAEEALRKALDGQRKSSGTGLRLLTESVISPTLGAQIQSLLKTFPDARWHQYDAIHNDQALAGARAAFGRVVNAVYDFSKADIVVSLDSDFLASGPGHVRYARDFMQRRTQSLEPGSTAPMNRLYVAETAVTCTGAKADHRLALPLSQIENLALALAGELRVAPSESSGGQHQPWIAAVARDLASHRGTSLVIAGPRQSSAVHALAHAINDQLGNVGKTVEYVEPNRVNPVECVPSLDALVKDLRAGKVELLLILGGNPVYSAPADFSLADLLLKAPQRFRLGLYADETSRCCQWHLPAAHYLESWGDARALDGTASLVQPLIEPLYQGRTELEFVAWLATEKWTPADELVREHWRSERERHGETGDFDDWWQTALHDGVIQGSTFSPLEVRLADNWQSALPPQPPSPTPSNTAANFNRTLEITFDADPTIYDGQWANNGWLQELPKPLTRLTWDNAAIMSSATAKRLGLHLEAMAHGGEHGGYRVSLVQLQLGGRTVRAPIWIMPGHADGAVTVHLGHGRTAAGRVGGDAEHPVGFNAFALRTSSQPWFGRDLVVSKLNASYSLACTQAHHTLDGRDIIRGGSLAEFRQQPERWKDPPGHESIRPPELPKTIYQPLEEGVPRARWGMSINLTSCVGCSACVVACQAENNIPVVGKEQVLFGREMHWLRVDRYISGSPEQPDEFHFQPLPCMHCEHAPCEYVCPVAATVHSADGLNDMVYNRCVGTRFCSNNCPYKVRRFNFLAYADFDTLSRRLQYNPEVTVRSRGVMEKCTYCIQRIRSAQIDAQAANRPLKDGECLTACQAVCPTSAIVFGDLNDPNSAVSRAKASPLEYGLLTELNTFPRTTYLAELRNPNPELEELPHGV